MLSYLVFPSDNTLSHQKVGQLPRSLPVEGRPWVDLSRWRGVRRHR